MEDAIQHQPADTVEVITLDELRAVRDELTTAAGEGLGAVSLGTPHASAAELRRYAVLLGGRQVHPDVELLVCTGRDVLAATLDAALTLEAAGAKVLTDTCSYIAPILRPTSAPVMTDSAKWAYYAPGNIGASVIFGSTGECIESAVAGRVSREAWA